MIATYTMDEFVSLFTGKLVGLCGAQNNQFRISVDGVQRTFEVFEDECDGYRSCMDRVEEIAGEGLTGFFAQPVTYVTITRHCDSYGDDDLVHLAGEISGHVWLEFGTKNTNDYYPYFVFNYEPATGASA